MIVKNEFNNVYNFYIGLYDKKTHKQKFDDNDFEVVLKGICETYKIGFSMAYVDGGYVTDQGVYVKERSLVLTVMGITNQQAHDIAKDICFFFNQEVVRVTKTQQEVIDVKC